MPMGLKISEKKETIYKKRQAGPKDKGIVLITETKDFLDDVINFSDDDHGCDLRLRLRPLPWPRLWL
jgi:hypothetical protein